MEVSELHNETMTISTLIEARINLERLWGATSLPWVIFASVAVITIVGLISTLVLTYQVISAIDNHEPTGVGALRVNASIAQSLPNAVLNSEGGINDAIRSVPLDLAQTVVGESNRQGIKLQELNVRPEMSTVEGMRKIGITLEVVGSYKKSKSLIRGLVATNPSSAIESLNWSVNADNVMSMSADLIFIVPSLSSTER